MQSANCWSEPSCSTMKQLSPRESVNRTICMNWFKKCQYWKCKPRITRSEVMICLNDQATIAWLTSTRGVYQVTFSAYEFYWGLKKVHHMQSPNCKSRLSCSAMIQPSPIGARKLFSWNNLKVSKLDKQGGIKKIISIFVLMTKLQLLDSLL